MTTGEVRIRLESPRQADVLALIDALDAIALYERCGYRRCGPFGRYVEDPNSVFMGKHVTGS